MKCFTIFSKKMIDKGATIIGGCCEIKPEHIKKVSELSS
ncbi:MAG: homocysteine S-methyltransferase family protein [Alphaproteobacteria bacterium]